MAQQCNVYDMFVLWKIQYIWKKKNKKRRMEEPEEEGWEMKQKLCCSRKLEPMELLYNVLMNYGKDHKSSVYNPMFNG